MKADILIKNGLVIDPFQGTKQVQAVAIKGQKIIAAQDDMEANQVIDAAGCIVSPGLIDFHGHFSDFTSDLGANAEMICFPTGVTTIVDGGTTGAATYLGFRSRTMASKLHTFALLHINPSGISTIAYHETQDPRYCDAGKMKDYMDAYRDQLIGLKVRLSRELVGDMGLEPLRYLRNLADEIGCPVGVHTSNPPCSVEELLCYFRPGDMFFHVFQGRGTTIIGEDGHVLPAVWEAQKNGVLFDAANGKNHFAFKTAEAALADGFLPDIISTDMSALNAFSRDRVFSLPFVMSKYLMLGLDVEKILRCVVLNPARALSMERELGSLLPGTTADIAIHRVISCRTRFEDTLGEERFGEQVFRTEMTICKGVIVFRTIEI